MSDALTAAREAAARIDPAGAARMCAFGYETTAEGGLIRARFLRADVDIAVPGFEQVGGDPLPPHVLAIVIYHLSRSDGSEPSGDWIGFADLPDGGFYVKAWRGYTGEVLVRRFGDDVEAVAAAAEALGATPADLPGDVAVVLDVMPRLPVAFMYWRGDDEFGARADYLFDATAPAHLVTDCVAVCCSWITGLLSRGAPAQSAGG